LRCAERRSHQGPSATRLWSLAMTIHLPPNEILVALLLATILVFVAAGVDLPPEDGSRD
jgi:hypothetical protein